MTIGKKLFLSFSFIATFAVLVTGLFTFQSAKEGITKRILSDLTLLTETQEGAVLMFLDRIAARTSDFASDGFIRDKTQEIVLGEADAVVIKELNQHLIKNKLSLENAMVGIKIIDLEGKTIAATADSEIGQTEPEDSAFHNLLPMDYGEVVLDTVRRGEYFGDARLVLAAAAPLYDRVGEHINGYLVAYLNANIFNDLMSGVYSEDLGAQSSLRGRSESFEMYLVDTDGYMISASRYIDDVVLNKLITIQPVLQCAFDIETTGFFESYTGKQNVGAAMCLPNGWTLVAELQEQEAFAEINKTQKQIGILILIVLAFGSLLSMVVVRKLVFPIRNLIEKTKLLESGDFSARTKIETNDELETLGNSFNSMVERLGELNEMKTEFISIASHQLRAPLATMKWYGQIVADGDAGVLTETQKEYIDRMNSSTERLITLVNDFLSISRIDSGKIQFNPEPVNIIDVINTLVDNVFNIQIQDKQIQYTLNTEKKVALVNVDPALIREVCSALIQNAIKYNREKGKITISFEEDEKLTKIIIQDTGIGIPDDEKSKIFSKFFRASNAVQSGVGGVGLGLHAVKQMVELMGGKIGFESTDGQGAAFTITLKKSDV